MFPCLYLPCSVRKRNIHNLWSIFSSVNPIKCCFPKKKIGDHTHSPKVTGSICRIPSTWFSQATLYTLLVHLCWFGESWSVCIFLICYWFQISNLPGMLDFTVLHAAKSNSILRRSTHLLHCFAVNSPTNIPKDSDVYLAKRKEALQKYEM